jgi:pimeloyl-ACP methyl ester carboxylesterase
MRNISPLYVHEAGSLQAPTIVFLHGLGGSGSMWQPQLEHLRDYHCLAPDLPEHGKSANIGPFTLADSSQRVAALIRERARNGRASIVGLSMGAAVAIRLLADMPGILDHVMVSGAAVRIDPVFATINRLNDPFIRFLSPDQLTEVMVRIFDIPEQYRGLLLADLRAFKREAFSHFNEELTKIELPRNVKIPTLITVGQKETFIVKQAAREISRTLPAKAVLVPQVGHVWNLEAPHLFSATVHAWVTGAPLPKVLVPL